MARRTRAEAHARATTEARLQWEAERKRQADELFGPDADPDAEREDDGGGDDPDPDPKRPAPMGAASLAGLFDDDLIGIVTEGDAETETLAAGAEEIRRRLDAARGEPWADFNVYDLRPRSWPYLAPFEARDLDAARGRARQLFPDVPVARLQVTRIHAA